MHGIHVRLDLEHETSQMIFGWLDEAFACHARQRSWRMCGEGRQQLLHTEIVDRRPEEHRCLQTRAILLRVKTLGGTFDELDFVVERLRQIAQELAPLRTVESFDGEILTHPAAL